MGMAARMFSESCKVTKAKPVSFQQTDKDGDEISCTFTTVGTPRDYSESEIKRIASTTGLKVNATKPLASGIKIKMPRTDAAGPGAERLIGIVFGSESETPMTQEEQTLLAELERENFATRAVVGA